MTVPHPNPLAVAANDGQRVVTYPLWLEAPHAHRSVTGSLEKQAVLETLVLIHRREVCLAQGGLKQYLPRSLVNSGGARQGHSRAVGPSSGESLIPKQSRPIPPMHYYNYNNNAQRDTRCM